MNSKYEELRAKAFSALQQLAKQSPDFEQARMLIGAADTEAALKSRTVRKTVDTEWIDRVEAALPALDLIIRTPTVVIEDQEEVVPVELTRRISEKSIKHLAQHTNLIREINGDEVTPSSILNVYHEESYLTYENKFVNTLLVRLAAFVDKRHRALVGGSGVEQNYEFDYGVDFEHFTQAHQRSLAKLKLHIELTSPLGGAQNDVDADLNAQYAAAIDRIRRINQAITAYLSSPFAAKLGRNFIRPPVIRTNAILKNKHFKECLTLWEYIEGYEKTGYSVMGEEFAQMPSDDYVTDLYGLLALQYTQFYRGIVDDEVKLLAERQMPEILPDFDRDVNEEEIEDFLVYDAEYKKMVPVSRLMNNRKKLSDDERRIREAIEVALRADEILTADLQKEEEQARRIERERIEAEERERARRAAMEEAARRGPIEVRYQRSFLSCYIQAGELLQGYYGEIKNKLLCFERVNARLSWKQETFRRGRTALARISIRGKSLCLSLALPVGEFEGKNHVSSVESKTPDTPLLVKVKSERSQKRALALIDEMMKRQGVAQIERASEDFSMPYESTEALVERGLIKRILPEGIIPNEFDQLVHVNVESLIAERKGQEPVAAESPVQEASDPGELSVQELSITQESTQSAATVAENTDARQIDLLQKIGGKYRRSFLSRYICADVMLQDHYTAIKNELLSYRRVSARISWKCETFRQGRTAIARINVTGKSLYLYLALSPAEYEGKNYLSDAGARNADTPLLIKVRSPRSLKRALELIEFMMQQRDGVRIKREAVDYHTPAQSIEALIAQGLVKPIAARVQTTADENEPDRAAVEQDLATVSKNEQIEPTEQSETVPQIRQDSASEAPRTSVNYKVPETMREYSIGEAVDLTQVDLNDVEFVHEVSFQQIESFGELLQAVVVGQKQVAARTQLQLKLCTIPKKLRKRMRVHAKNLVCSDEQPRQGIEIPYTKREHAQLSANEKKQLLEDVKRVREYSLTRSQIALICALKSNDLKMITKLKDLEATLDLQANALPQTARWKEWIVQ